MTNVKPKSTHDLALIVVSHLNTYTKTPLPLQAVHFIEGVLTGAVNIEKLRCAGIAESFLHESPLRLVSPDGRINVTAKRIAEKIKEPK